VKIRTRALATEIVERRTEFEYGLGLIRHNIGSFRKEVSKKNQAWTDKVGEKFGQLHDNIKIVFTEEKGKFDEINFEISLVKEQSV
jgi:hypothetical protein